MFNFFPKYYDYIVKGFHRGKRAAVQTVELARL